MKEGPLVSVITPVYNGEPYIAECIESILVQTYKNWDFTVVEQLEHRRHVGDDCALRRPRLPYPPSSIRRIRRRDRKPQPRV